jgi:hypothetical protein
MAQHLQAMHAHIASGQAAAQSLARKDKQVGMITQEILFILPFAASLDIEKVNKQTGPEKCTQRVHGETCSQVCDSSLSTLAQ